MIKAILATRLIGWLATLCALFFVGFEYLERHQSPDAFYWFVFAAMMAGIAAIGEFITRFVLVAWMLICVSLGSEP